MFTLDVKALAGIAVVLAVALLFGWLIMSRNSLKAELAQANANYMLCISANEEYVGKVLEANKIVEQYKKENEQLVVKAAEAQEKAKKEAAKHKDFAQELQTAKPTGDDCAASKRLFDDYLRRRK